jgi:hypothetical protein
VRKKIYYYSLACSVGFFQLINLNYFIINDDKIVLGIQFSGNTPETRTLKITAEKVPFEIANNFYINYINTGNLDKYNIDVSTLNLDGNIGFEKRVL